MESDSESDSPRSDLRVDLSSDLRSDLSADATSEGGSRSILLFGMRLLKFYPFLLFDAGDGPQNQSTLLAYLPQKSDPIKKSSLAKENPTHLSWI